MLTPWRTQSTEEEREFPEAADLSRSVVGLEFLTHPTSELTSQGEPLLLTFILSVSIAIFISEKILPSLNLAKQWI